MFCPILQLPFLAISRHSDSSIAELLVSNAIIPCVILWRFIAGWAVVAEDIGEHRVDAARGEALPWTTGTSPQPPGGPFLRRHGGPFLLRR